MKPRSPQRDTTKFGKRFCGSCIVSAVRRLFYKEKSWYHDRRHFNNVLLELLERGQTGEAAALLQSQNQATPIISKVYCENPAVNAAVCHYAGLAEQAGIPAEIALDIPENLDVDTLELSMQGSTVTYAVTSGGESVAVNGNTVTLQKPGTVTITATSKLAGYGDKTKTVTFTVKKRAVNVTAQDQTMNRMIK